MNRCCHSAGTAFDRMMMLIGVVVVVADYISTKPSILTRIQGKAIHHLSCYTAISHSCLRICTSHSCDVDSSVGGPVFVVDDDDRDADVFVLPKDNEDPLAHLDRKHA